MTSLTLKAFINVFTLPCTGRVERLVAAGTNASAVDREGGAWDGCELLPSTSRRQYRAQNSYQRYQRDREQPRLTNHRARPRSEAGAHVSQFLLLSRPNDNGNDCFVLRKRWGGLVQNGQQESCPLRDELQDIVLDSSIPLDYYERGNISFDSGHR